MSDFTFYFTIGVDEWRPQWLTKDIPIMLPASSFGRYGLRKVKEPFGFIKKAADSGGFIASQKGGYTYTPQQYVNWLDEWQPDWSATMDFCCENEITSGKAGIVQDRQKQTTEMAHLFWDNYKDRPYAWVPTIQGWRVSDYINHAREMKELIGEMQSFYEKRAGQESEFRVGIGTLCRRINIKAIIAIVMSVASVLPEVERFHLWGVKTTLWNASVAFPFSISSDSASWNMPSYYGQRKPVWKQWVEEQKAMGDDEASNRKHRCLVDIPRTRMSIEQAMNQPKQYLLF